jgi:hypothetical protein
MSLLKREADRMAAALNDFDLLSVTGMDGSDNPGYTLTICDERFNLEYEITSHFDYWDFLGHFLNHAEHPAGRTGAFKVA